MAMRSVLIGSTAALVIGGCGVEEPGESGLSPDQAPPVDPLNASYRIEGSDIPLRNGYFETPAAPDSATKITVAAVDSPVYGDLNADASPDAALALVYQAGGSGTFFYIAAAVNQAGVYRGTNALLLGDRIRFKALDIQRRNIVAEFTDRKPDDAMAAAPTLPVTRYAYLDGEELVAVPTGNDETGWVTFGHEVRTFLPCNRDAEHWVLGRSPAISDIETTYRNTMADALPYAPLFMRLTGSFVRPPRVGFGVDYAGGFFATGLVEVKPTGHCREDFIAVESPVAGEIIESPLSINGRARGSWFFEGDFPIVLEDAHGNVLANGFVTAQGEWMTQEFVPFTGSLSFTGPRQGERGSLIFKKDNPSDKPELDDAMKIPVFFKN
jgi:hypothetical protein